MPTAVRCPGCGAKNPDGSVKCRICGADLRGDYERPRTQPEPGSERMRDGRLWGLAGLAVLGVLGIVLVGILLGLLPGGDVVTSIRNKVPFLATQSDDGWEEFTQPDARFRASLPVDRVQGELAFPGVAGGTTDAWISTLGPDDAPDTELTIRWAATPGVEGEDVESALTSLAVAWADSLGGRLTRDDPASFQGLPALLVTVEELPGPGGEETSVEALLIRQRDHLFVLESRSIYDDHPQWARLVEGFALL